MVLLFRFSVYILAGVVFLGAFSRFTHGRYTPNWYAFQEYHAKDDGSATALITPIIDTVVGVMLLFQKTQFTASCISAFFFFIGLIVQLNAGKKYLADVALIALAGFAIVGAKLKNHTPSQKTA